MRNPKTLAVYYEHQEWFRPLFAELDRRAVPFVALDATRHSYDPREIEVPYSLVFNRMSPSAYLRGHGHGIFYTQQYLNHLENAGTRVINGQKAFAIEISKARQLSLLDSLLLPYPRTRVINTPSLAVAAAEGLRFPIVVKANIGGSGAGIFRFDTRAQLIDAVDNNQLNLGIDHTALVQEYIPARGGHITRVETLAGKYLYAIKVFTTGDTFNLCPADICQTTDGKELTRTVDAPRSSLRVEAFQPPPDVIRDVERIVCAAEIEVGGVEYIVDDRDGSLLYYDINALSNFVADAPRVIGFDPHVRLVDFLEKEVTRFAGTVFAIERKELCAASN